MADRPAGTDLGRRVWALFTAYRRSLVLIVVAVLVQQRPGHRHPVPHPGRVRPRAVPGRGRAVDLRLLAWLVAGMVAIPVVSALIGVWQTYLTTLLGNRVMADLRSRLFAHLQRMDLAFFTATRTGAIQSRLANDVGGVQSVLSETASSILSNTVTVVAALVAMLLLSWPLTLVAVALLPLFVLLQVRVGRVRRRLAGRTQESLSDMTAITEESLSVSGVLLAKVFNRQAPEVERYTAENARQVDLQVRQAMTGQSFFAVVQTFLAVTPALVYLVAGLPDRRRRRALRGHDRRVHHAAGAAAVPDREPAAGLAGRADLARAVRPDLRVPRPAAAHRRRPGRAPARPRRGHRAGRVRRRLVRLPRARGRRDGARGAGHPPVGGAGGRRSSSSRASSRRSSGRAARARPRSPTSSRGCTTSTRARCCSTGTTSATLTQASVADAIGMVTQDTYLLHATIAENLRYASPTPPTRSSRPRRGRRTSTTGSCRSPRATTPSSGSAGTGSRAGRSSASPSRGCCSRTRRS